MKVLRQFVKKILGDKLISLVRLRKSFREDYLLYKKYSSLFSVDSYEKIESEITLRYHSIEKGFLHKKIRPFFAKKRVVELLELLNKLDLEDYKEKVQIQAALCNLCNYYKYHKDNNFDISDYFSDDYYTLFKSLLNKHYGYFKTFDRLSYFKYTKDSFELFSQSRSSIRSFTREKVPLEVIKKVVCLANHAPSVCNRQPFSALLVQKEDLVEKVFKLQSGLKGYYEEVSQVLVVISDRQYYYTVGERNQLYVDGGMFLMNLLYALHYYEIAACPAHWAMPSHVNRSVIKLLNLKESQQVICLIAIGYPQEDIRATLSLRRDWTENLYIIE